MQADTSTTRNYGGTRLGLTISARLVSMMGGKIWLESEMGQGSQFHFTVQFRQCPKCVQPEPIVSSELLRGVRVLVVDDNATNRRILQEILKGWEVEVTCAEGGESALQELESAHRRPFQLVLTDVQMPRMDGFALVEEIRRRSGMEMLAIVMLTSAARGGDAERCRALGSACYIFKPVRKPELLSAILEVLGQRSAVANSPRVLPPPKAVAPASGLNILLAEDNHVNQVVAKRILEKMGHSVTLANNGAEAISLLATQTFDLVLMDIQMPQLDGFAATKQIRTSEAQTHLRLPIIAMTAHAMKGDRERCLEAGMDGYVSKPITASELGSAIANVMHWQL